MKQDADENLAAARDAVETLHRALGYGTERHPNVLPYTLRRSGIGRPRAARGVTGAAYVVRQHLYATLLDRLSMRPFLSVRSIPYRSVDIDRFLENEERTKLKKRKERGVARR